MRSLHCKPYDGWPDCIPTHVCMVAGPEIPTTMKLLKSSLWTGRCDRPSTGCLRRLRNFVCNLEHNSNSTDAIQGVSAL